MIPNSDGTFLRNCAAWASDKRVDDTRYTQNDAEATGSL